MENIIVLYWKEGSGGDFLVNMFAHDNRYTTTYEHMELDNQGRTVPSKPKKMFEPFGGPQEIFDPWSCFGHIEAQKILGKKLIVPTHRIETVKLFKEMLSDKCTTIGIDCPKHTWPFVLKNRVKKLLVNDKNTEKHYPAKLVKKFKQKKIYEWYLMIEQLKYYDNTEFVKQDYDFNITLDFQEILIGNFAVFEQYLDKEVCKPVLDQWVSKQEMLSSCISTLDEDIKDILGYNAKAIRHINLADIQLQNVDKALLTFFLDKHNISFKGIDTLEDLKYFLRSTGTSFK